MTTEEFVSRAMALPGIQWRRWCSGWDYSDCFGLLVLFHREVRGVDLGPVPQTDIAAGFALVDGWQECEPGSAAACFMAWRDGAPTHCGIVLGGGMVLHAEGSPEHPGSVRVSRLAAIERIYGAARFYRYTRC